MKQSNPICDNPLRTKSDFQEAVRQLCNPLESFYSNGCARLNIGSTGSYCTEAVAQMEAFSRPLWGLVPLAAGGGDSKLLSIYQQGIRYGTDPKHEEYWGDLTDIDQRMVEMAVLGLALAMAPDKVWEPLNDMEKGNLVSWMDQINQHVVVDSNWLFFRVLVNLGLKKVGTFYRRDIMDKDLNRLDEFYLSDGWYQDGISEQRDYYIPFAFHYYSLIYAALMGAEDEERLKRYKDRAVRFARDFIYWFSEDGSAIPFGRSLIYRFAQSAFWSALAFAGVEALPWGVIKGIVCRNLRWWFKQPIFSSDCVLTIGYAYPNLNMAEGYNAPGSPYWALKTFLPLALPEAHPFWNAEEEELPILPGKSVQQHPHMIICRQDEGKHVLAFTSGQHAAFEPVHGAAKYEKFVYSNIFGFSVSKGDFGLEQGAYDSMLALSEGDNLFRVRRKCIEYKVGENFIYSKWMPWQDVEVDSWIIPMMPWHIRIHKIRSNRYLETAEGGFAIAREKDFIVPDGNETIYERNGVVMKHPWGISGIVDILGDRKPEIIRAEPNTNILVPRTLIPYIKGKVQPGERLLVCAVLGELSDSHSWENPPKVSVQDGIIKVKKNLAIKI